MKRILLSLSIFLAIFVVSCKKNNSSSENVTPEQKAQLTKCPLLVVNNPQGKAINKFEYTLGRLKRIVSNDSTETSVVFTYNSKNQIEKMDVIMAKSANNFNVNYTYDATGKINKSKTFVQGIEILNNEFIYETDKITKVNSVFTIFGYTIKSVTRVEYNGKTVSKVFTKIEGDPELLTFEGTGYDTKIQIYPDGYRTMAMGFVGMANNFFAFFGENNPTQVKIYDENGKLDETIDIAYEYNKNGFPTKGTKNITKDGKKSTVVVSYIYNCN